MPIQFLLKTAAARTAKKNGQMPFSVLAARLKQVFCITSQRLLRSWTCRKAALLARFFAQLPEAPAKYIGASPIKKGSLEKFALYADMDKNCPCRQRLVCRTECESVCSSAWK